MNRGTLQTRFRILGAAAFAVLLSLVVVSGSTARGFDKPAKPAKDVPTAAGLLAPVQTSTTQSTTSTTTSTRKDTSYAQPLGSAAPGAIGAKTLVLYDTANSFGWLGELYAMYTGNLASHFGTWKAEPVSQYTAGQIGQYTATVYIGSTYDEPLSDVFLTDVANATRPVIWIYDNIWELSNKLGYNAFLAKYGWHWTGFDTTAVSNISYKGQVLSRDSADNGAGIMAYTAIDTTKATPLAWARHDSDGSEFPWALKSGNLIYFGENPFVYTSETDRVMAFDDILTSVLNPFAPTRHRALLRLEDLSPADDPQTVMELAQWLYSQHIDYGFGFTPMYTDPLGYLNGGVPETYTLADRQGKAMADVVRYMQSHGGTLIMHGYTHQYSNVPNPYTAVTDDDFEFYRTVENADHTLNFVGPVPEDSSAWAAGRISKSFQVFQRAKAAAPAMFEFPHYFGSEVDYKVVAQLFKTRWERSLYFGGELSGTSINYGHLIGQFFPFVVRDVYGTTVLPENVGNYEPQPFYQFPIHTIDDVVKGAKAESVVRDGVVGAYYHNFWGLQPLKDMVSGLQSAGYTFVDPDTVAING